MEGPKKVEINKTNKEEGKGYEKKKLQWRC